MWKSSFHWRSDNNAISIDSTMTFSRKNEIICNKILTTKKKDFLFVLLLYYIII